MYVFFYLSHSRHSLIPSVSHHILAGYAFGFFSKMGIFDIGFVGGKQERVC